MNPITSKRLGLLFVTKDDVILCYSQDKQVWRDMYAEHEYNSSSDGIPVNANILELEGEFTDKEYDLVRAKCCAVDEATTLKGLKLLKESHEDLVDDEDENLNTLANSWASAATEDNISLDFDEVHGNIYDHLCFVFPDES